MRTIYFEMRKSWLKISTLVMLVICTALNVYRLNDTSKDYFYTNGKFQEPYFRLYETVCGELDNEKITEFRRRKNELENIVQNKMYTTEYLPEEYPYTGYAFGDFSLYSLAVAPEITYCATYENKSNRIAAKAAEAYNSYREIGNDYEMKTNALIYKLYSGRAIPEYRATNWANEYFTYDFSSLLCIIMVILGLSSSFTAERSSGMDQLIAACGKSGNSIAAKIVSAAVFCFALTAYFTVCDLVFINKFLGIKGINMPIYSVPMLQNSPFSFDFLDAFFVCAGLRFLGLMGLSLLILLLSRFSPNTIISVAGAFAAVLILIFLSLIGGSVLNPICLLTPKTYLCEFGTVNLLGFPVLSLYAAVISTVLLSIVQMMIIFVGRKSNASSRN